MKRWKAAGLVILTLSCGVFIWGGAEYAVRRHHKAQEEQAFASKFAALAKDLPLGSSEDAVAAYLHDPEIYRSVELQDRFDLPLQTITSTEWYCSRWEGYAELQFSPSPGPKRLVSLTSSEQGMDCL